MARSREPNVAQLHVYDPWALARYEKKLRPALVREALDAPGCAQHLAWVFLHEYIRPLRPLDDAALSDVWGAALKKLGDLHTSYGWGSKQHRAKMDGVAADPRGLAAVQAAVASYPEAPLDFLAVLVVDSSEASFDAFLPHFERATRERGKSLEILQWLRKYARPDTSMETLLDRVDDAADEREAASPALRLAAAIGLGKRDRFWFQLYTGSAEGGDHGVPAYQLHVNIDSRRAEWFSIQLARSGAQDSTVFNSQRVWRDDLELGSCQGEDIPDYLARAAVELGITWHPAGALSSNVRGRKRDLILAWLSRGVTPPEG